MMTIIDRYVLRAFLGGYAILLGVGLTLYVLIDLFLNLDDFTAEGTLPLWTAFGYMVDYYRYNLPLFFAQLTGPMMGVSAGFALAVMLRNNEMVPLAASGMPLQRLVVPLAVGSVLLVGLSVANREILIPRIAPKIARQRDDVAGFRTRALRFARDDEGRRMTAKDLNVATGELRGLYIVEPARDNGQGDIIRADRARYDAEQEVWLLERGVRIRFEDRVQNIPISRYAFGLTPAELVLRRSSEWSGLLSFRQLDELSRRPSMPNSAQIAQTRYNRLTEPLIQWILLALSLPFFLTREPTHVLNAGGKALALAGAFFAVTFVSQELASGLWQSRLAAGLPIILFGPLAILKLMSAKT